MSNGALCLTLPGAHSWRRPRAIRGFVRYPTAYEQDRQQWAIAVEYAVREAGWCPPEGARYAVAVDAAVKGRCDLDRVVTAVLDALQSGGAVRDDCLVDSLKADRRRVRKGEAPRTAVRVEVLRDRPRRESE